MKIKEYFYTYYIEIIVILIGLIFGSFLMFSSFSKVNNSLMISTKSWSDFASHIPLIRSFSLGENFPPEYPLFPGEPIKYHFIFYAGVGILEKIGVPIDLALNIPSILGFAFLCFMIFLLAKTVFKSNFVGLFSVFFFIFNSSLSYFYYFKNYPLSIKSITNIPFISNFQSFAPYDKGIVSAFWNLNIYTNQRHLALSFGLSFLIIYLILKPIFIKGKPKIKIFIVLGILLGLSFFLHMAVFIMTSSTIFFMAIMFKSIRKYSILLLFIASIIALPQYIYLNSTEGFKMFFHPGYLVANEFTYFKFVESWIYNLGISMILIPVGFVLANRNQKKILIAFIPLFIMGNLIQFSPEIAANHKFFNFFALFTNMFCAFAIYLIWKRNFLLKLVAVIFAFFMIFGGIIDFFPLLNDHKITINDIKANPNAKWILENTPKDSIFLNTIYLYDPASLAGRKIFFGWPYFAWSQGYNTYSRGDKLKEILGSTNKLEACKLLKQNNIGYVEIKIETPSNPDLPPISSLWQNEFDPIYKNAAEKYTIYKTSNNCQ